MCCISLFSQCPKGYESRHFRCQCRVKSAFFWPYPEKFIASPSLGNLPYLLNDLCYVECFASLSKSSLNFGTVNKNSRQQTFDCREQANVGLLSERKSVQGFQKKWGRESPDLPQPRTSPTLFPHLRSFWHGFAFIVSVSTHRCLKPVKVCSLPEARDKQVLVRARSIILFAYYTYFRLRDHAPRFNPSRNKRDESFTFRAPWRSSQPTTSRMERLVKERLPRRRFSRCEREREREREHTQARITCLTYSITSRWLMAHASWRRYAYLLLSTALPASQSLGVHTHPNRQDMIWRRDLIIKEEKHSRHLTICWI